MGSVEKPPCSLQSAESSNMQLALPAGPERQDAADIVA